jgi:hypothetical protein
MATDDFLLWGKNNFKYKKGLGNAHPALATDDKQICRQIVLLSIIITTCPPARSVLSGLFVSAVVPGRP